MRMNDDHSVDDASEVVPVPVVGLGTPSEAFAVTEEALESADLSNDAFQQMSRRSSDSSRRSSFTCKFTDAYKRRSSVLGDHIGMPPFVSACVVVNYISFGYVLLPWGKCVTAHEETE